MRHEFFHIHGGRGPDEVAEGISLSGPTGHGVFEVTGTGTAATAILPASASRLADEQ